MLTFIRKHFRQAEECFARGFWDEAENNYQRVIEAFDRHLTLSHRDELNRTEAIRKLQEISLAMHRQDDAEIWGSLLNEAS